MASEDITFCANTGCADMSCYRNPKHILLRIPHSFALFPECPKWKPGNAKWLTEQFEDNKVRQTDYTGKCGTCSRFERDGDKRSGWCHAKPFGADVVCDPKHPYPMYPMSRIKCIMYAPAKMDG